ncbi:hypothetical protein RYX36_032948, partial [Vicia faba]
MVQVAKRKRSGKVKTCRLPSALRQLWLSKANDSRFLQGRRKASRIHFINVLVNIWQLIVQKFSLSSDQSGTGKSTSISLLYNHLEVFMLTTILELAVEIQSDLIQSQSITFLEILFKSALLYRFSDPKTMKTLQKCQKRKDVMGLRLLMNSVQNSIEESWRRIPSVIALFAAEASCVLLDSSHDHYAAICTFLTQSSTMNMKELLPSVVSALCLLTFGAYNLQVGRTILLQDYDTIISSNSLRVRCPLEANPDWRWSFYQPRKDQSLEFTGT